jgi:hypothetical protein
LYFFKELFPAFRTRYFPDFGGFAAAEIRKMSSNNCCNRGYEIGLSENELLTLNKRLFL